MSGENKARHFKNCTITSEIIPEEYTIQIGDSNKSNVPPQKRKEDAKPTLYLDRI